MTTTQTQQPKALQLADRLKERIRQLNNSWNAKWNRSTEEFDLCAKSEDELRYQHAEIARLTAENRALRSGCKPLTSEQKTAIFQSRAGANDHGVPYLRCYREGFEHIVADIEAAHGIGEKV